MSNLSRQQSYQSLREDFCRSFVFPSIIYMEYKSIQMICMEKIVIVIHPYPFFQTDLDNKAFVHETQGQIIQHS